MPRPTGQCRVADWFAQLNNKMGGDLKKIQTVGQYFVEIWKAVGMDMTRVQFLNASEEINKKPDEYWQLVRVKARLSLHKDCSKSASTHDRSWTWHGKTPSHASSAAAPSWDGRRRTTA